MAGAAKHSFLLLCAGFLLAGQGLAGAVDAPALRAAAEAGDAGAQTLVGLLETLDGQGAAEIVDLDIAVFRRGPISIRLLSVAPQPPIPGFRRDIGDAVRWLTRAADRGKPEAQYSLGLLSLLGRGVGADPRRAAGWFTKAAEQGYGNANSLWVDLADEIIRVGAHNDLAYFYLGAAAEGRGFPEAAKIYYRLAIEEKRKGLSCDEALRDVCQGIVLPRDAEQRLQELP